MLRRHALAEIVVPFLAISHAEQSGGKSFTNCYLTIAVCGCELLLLWLKTLTTSPMAIARLLNCI